MEIFAITAVIILLLVGAFLKLKSSGRKSTPVKIDFMFFNNEGLKCRDGQLINCNIIVHGNSSERISRESLSNSYMKALQLAALDKDSAWFFAEKSKRQELFLSEFQRICGSIKVEDLEIAHIAYADECFTDVEMQENHQAEYKAKVKKELEEDFAHREQNHQANLKKLEDEAAAAMKKVEEETAAEIARINEEVRLEQERIEREIIVAEKREEEINKENNI